MRLLANGLEHFVHTWGERGGDPVVLLHGYMDAGGTWDLVAPRLAEAGHWVIAPDLRGYGRTERLHASGYYHFPDYVADVAALTRALELASFRLVGHSMGGTIATLFSGAAPDRVRSLVLIEGAGPPDNAPEVAPDRMARWLADVAASPKERAMDTMDAVIERLRVNHPRVPRSVLASRAAHLVRGEGPYQWAFDPRHRTTSPMPFFASIYKAFASRVACPVLWVSGGTDGWHPPDEGARLDAFKSLARAEIDGAGHMVHWTRANELAREILTFFASASADEA